MIRRFTLTILFSIISILAVAHSKDEYKIKSPDGKVELCVNSEDGLWYAVEHEKTTVLMKSVIALNLDQGISLPADGQKPVKVTTGSENETFDSPFYKKSKVVDNYNSLTITYKNFSVEFRAYDDGVCYRFISNLKRPFKVISERAEFHFLQDFPATFSYVNNQGKDMSFEQQFDGSFENLYTYDLKISEWDKKRYAFSPIVIHLQDNKKAIISESNIKNYPGMLLYNYDGGKTLSGIFAPYPEELRQGGYRNLRMKPIKVGDYIAKYDSDTDFPWRIVGVVEDECQLTNSDFVYRLADAPESGSDYSWVKPGKVAWDWWNDWNIVGVDFKTGPNNDTYKYYIDFASKSGIEYVILDEGWAVRHKADLFNVVPEINLEELCAYAEERGVGLILWAGYWAFHRDMERVCAHYSKMGIKGFKIDFMQRYDQIMTNFHYEAAKVAAKYNLLVDFHGTYHPTGLHRTFPNVLNYEGVHGLENMKWSTSNIDQITYDVTIPFIRMYTGPMDYTQGAMKNAHLKNFYPSNSEPMSQGTRCRQLAEYVIFDSPLNMLCDSPTNYEREIECTQFIAEIPEVWDETIAINGKIGKYVTMARRSGDVWYLGSLTNLDSRELEIDLSFLGSGNYKMTLYKDGVNVDKAACDYIKQVIDIPADRKIKINMYSGSGFAARIEKR